MDIDIGLYTFIVDLEDFQPATVFPKKTLLFQIEDREWPLAKKNYCQKKICIENYKDMMFNAIENKGTTYTIYGKYMDLNKEKNMDRMLL